MHYLITGHTGFKGSWLTLLLKSRGHDVSGVALDAPRDGLFNRADIASDLKTHIIQDIRDRSGIQNAIELVSPDVVIHMAAQPLVLESYKAPIETFDTNVTGTLNVLAACGHVESVKAVLIVTTDKVYRDDGVGGYSESSPLGGYDPYSASKAMADILVQSWINLSPRFQLGVARAGNVIGFGDVSENRLIPDINRALSTGSEVSVRNPESVRPWQHVLDCLNGYTLFTDSMLTEAGTKVPKVLNFGPTPDSYRKVSELVAFVKKEVPELRLATEASLDHSAMKETSFLTLDSSAAREALGWHDKVSFEDAVSWSIDSGEADPRSKVLRQIANFESLT
jgi:CDP-glucose 4,6-dehydratase